MTPTASIVLRDLQERMLFAETLETVKCLDEGVNGSVAKAEAGETYADDAVLAAA